MHMRQTWTSRSDQKENVEFQEEPSPLFFMNESALHNHSQNLSYNRIRCLFT